jgi:conjugal transfer pilus assembly protein TraB
LQRLSCVRSPGKYIIDIPVEGTINDMGGSDGIRGHVVMRNNKLIWNAGISGVLSGIGGAAQQSLTTQSVSPLGVTNSIQPNKVFQSGMFGGANTALGKLADYYIKLADMYHPIVQVHAGSQVNIVFLKGFSLTEGQAPLETKEADKVKNTITSQSDIQQNLTQNTKDLSLGQSVDANNSINNEVAA